MKNVKYEPFRCDGCIFIHRQSGGKPCCDCREGSLHESPPDLGPKRSERTCSNCEHMVAVGHYGECLKPDSEICPMKELKPKNFSESRPDLNPKRRSPKKAERFTKKDLDKEIKPNDVDSKLLYGSKKSAPFLKALTEVWRVSQFGEQKHGANNWMNAKAEGMEHYEYALWRHWIERRQGETHAEDSKCWHLAHMAWNALMLLEMELHGITNPDWDPESDDK